MKELRKFIRYSLDSGSYSSAFVEIENKNRLRGVISDLSAGGFSFIINIGSQSETDLALEKYLFIKINFDSHSINAEVEKKWSLVNRTGNDNLITAGVCFKVISNEDRLRLNEIIENLRSESSIFRRKKNLY